MWKYILKVKEEAPCGPILRAAGIKSQGSQPMSVKDVYNREPNWVMGKIE